jgi:hypothetical protein
VLFRDDFNTENGRIARSPMPRLANWEIVAGSVDLAGSYPFELLPPGHGMYVDLDGATGHAGTLRTRRAFRLAPGEYVLRFLLAGPQRRCDVNVVHVSMGALYRETFRVSAFDPPTRYERSVHVPGPVEVRIEISNEGGDDRGALLDDVELRRR